MHLSSTLTLLAAIASPATSRSVPTIVSSTTPRARTVATHYGQWARLLVLEQRENRQAHDETIRPDKQELCIGLEPSDDHEVVGRECNYGCDKTHENIVYTCKFTNGELCDETEKYCVTDIRVKFAISLDFYIDGLLYNSNLESRSQFEESLKNVNLDDLLDEETCMTYTRVPTEMAELEGKESCISIEAGDDIDALFNVVMEDKMADEFEITSCGFTLGDKPCKCSICNNGIGVNLECPNIGIITEDCTNIRPLEWLDAQDFTAARFSVIPLTKTVPSSPGNLYIVPVSLCIGLLCWYKKGCIYDWFRYLTGAASDSNDPSNLEMRKILSDSPSQDSTHIIYHPPIL